MSLRLQRGHVHAQGASSSTRMLWAFLLNLVFSLIEFIGGLLTGSTAILADAVHDFADALSIGLAVLLQKKSESKASDQFTYGYQRLGMAGALITALVLLLGSVFVLTQAVPRLLNPTSPDTAGMIGLALLGVVVNGFAALKLVNGSSMNEKMLNLHLIEDVLGWVLVLIVAVVMHFVHAPVLDPLLSIGFTLWIMLNVYKHSKKTLALFLQANPDASVLTQIKQSLGTVESVDTLHSVHLWSLDGERHVLSAHVVLGEQAQTKDYSFIKTKLAEALKPYKLANTTLEIEFYAEHCRDRHADHHPSGHHYSDHHHSDHSHNHDHSCQHSHHPQGHSH